MTLLTGELHFKLVQNIQQHANCTFSNCILRDHTIYSTVLQPASSSRKRPIYSHEPLQPQGLMRKYNSCCQGVVVFTSSDPRSVVNSATIKTSCSIVHTPMPIGRHWNLQIPNLLMQVTKPNHTASITTKLDKHISPNFNLKLSCKQFLFNSGYETICQKKTQNCRWNNTPT